eukprot:symbB.v1.2.021149.t1/scaffold1812.1/size105704/13
MADDDDHKFESADAGASATYPMQAGEIRKGSHLMIKGRPCKCFCNCSDVTEEINDLQDPDEQRQRLTEIREAQINNLRNGHRGQFPLTDNLMSLVFLVQADLNENQRERFVTSMSLRQIDMAQYTYLQVKQLFMELFCTTRTGIADPTIRHVKRSTFLVIEEGEYDGETGYWVAEEETGDEGFVSLYIEDEFWVLSAKGGYNKRRVFSRRFKQGKRKP